MPNMDASPVIDRLVRACAQLMSLKKILQGGGGFMDLSQLLLSQCDSRPQERVLFPNPQPGELVSANVATLLDQTVERLSAGNRTG